MARFCNLVRPREKHFSLSPHDCCQSIGNGGHSIARWAGWPTKISTAGASISSNPRSKNSGQFFVISGVGLRRAVPVGEHWTACGRALPSSASAALLGEGWDSISLCSRLSETASNAVATR